MGSMFRLSFKIRMKDSAEENERMLMEALTRADRDMYLDKARSKQMK
jgi:hypothetical protein